ncbi:MAG: HNH endonuclease signature motif containing protein [Dongiaceae bacterium]
MTKNYSKSRAAEARLTADDLHRMFLFDFANGAIYRRKDNKRMDLLHFFRQNSSQNVRYKQVQMPVDGQYVKISAHRMIWCASKGTWPAPDFDIDHINSDTLDNRLVNLEEVSERVNIVRGIRKKLARDRA